MATVYGRVFHFMSRARRFYTPSLAWQSKVQNFCARKIRASGGL